MTGEQRVNRFYGAKSQARVAAGAALLDRIAPGWWRRVRIRELDLRDECNCVTGQLFGTYAEGLRKLDLNAVDAEHYGFHQDERDLGYGGSWWALTRAWRDEIRARRYGRPVGRQT